METRLNDLGTAMGRPVQSAELNAGYRYRTGDLNGSCFSWVDERGTERDQPLSVQFLLRQSYSAAVSRVAVLVVVAAGSGA